MNEPLKRLLGRRKSLQHRDNTPSFSQVLKLLKVLCLSKIAVYLLGHADRHVPSFRLVILMSK